jgi:GT2 family glycosyltransferase
MPKASLIDSQSAPSRQPRSASDPRGRVPFSVVIPTKNRADDVIAAVAGLLKQTLPPAEVIIIDQSATDECERALSSVWDDRRIPVSLRYERDPSIDGLTAARNRALELAREDWILYLDDDSVPAPLALERLSEAIRNAPKLRAVCGIITNYRRPSMAWRLANRLFHLGRLFDERQPVYWSWSTLPESAIIPTGKMNGGMTAIRRDALVCIGGFDRRYRGACVGEDIEASQRLTEAFGSGVLAFVGGAYLEHASRGDWKKTGPKEGVQLIAAHYIVSRASTRKAFLELAFGWLVTGSILAALAHGVRHRHWSRLREIRAALRCARHQYDGCPFIREASDHTSTCQ